MHLQMLQFVEVLNLGDDKATFGLLPSFNDCFCRYRFDQRAQW
jgi:hypothetical protein